MANNANILLHGLFVLQYQGNKLIAMTPCTGHHQFLMRQQGLAGNDNGPSPNPFPPLPRLMDYTNLVGGYAKVPFPSAMPQFSKGTTGVGDLIANPGPTDCRCRIELNFPLDITVLRLKGGQMSDYPSNSQSVVGQDIKSRSGPDLGLVTLLHYETSEASFTISLFAEHRMPPSKPSDMNPVLAANQSLFSNPTAFDLQLVDGGGVHPICPDYIVPSPAQGYGVVRDDEHSFGEIYDNQDCAGLRKTDKKDSVGILATDVASCVQFGLLD